ncbi:MAG: SOUL family heme-binding protein [Minwuia sp.]|uniref:SOUL family heme-binding protein n=1 Tax=Minwuia sp. TaxID=2493630 RepID=UPI003A856BAC
MRPAHPSRLFRGILGVLALTAFLAGCSVVGDRSGTGQIHYDVIGDLGDGVEIRQYPPRVAAEVTDRDGANSAFRTLAAYIFGRNRSGTEIAMTAPVEMQPAAADSGMAGPVDVRPQPDGSVHMRFFLPAGFDLETAPLPLDEAVRLRELPTQSIAALRFSGLRDDERTREHQARLLDRLEGSGWRAAGPPSAFHYDPPWTLPFLRRNEAVVPVEPGPEARQR